MTAQGLPHVVPNPASHPTMDLRMPIPRLVWALFMADLVICGLFALNEIADRPGAKLSALVGLDHESNLPTWYSSAQYLVTGCGLAVLAVFRPAATRSTRLLLWALAAAILVFSLDEVAEIHEWLGVRSDALLPAGDRGNTPFRVTGVWMFVIALPVVATLLVMLWRLERHLGARASRLLGIGLIVMAMGAAGIETLSNFVAPGTGAWALQVFFEEQLEMLGGTFLLWGTYEALRAHRVMVRFGVAPPHPRPPRVTPAAAAAARSARAATPGGAARVPRSRRRSRRP
jgi:hypothetical protein